MKTKIEKVNATIKDYEKLYADHERATAKKMAELDTKQKEYQAELDRLNTELTEVDPTELDGFFSKVADMKNRIDSIITLRQKVSPTNLEIDPGAFSKAWSNESKDYEKAVLTAAAKFYKAIQELSETETAFRIEMMKFNRRYKDVENLANKLELPIMIDMPTLPNMPSYPEHLCKTEYSTNRKEWAYNGKEFIHA